MEISRNEINLLRTEYGEAFYLLDSKQFRKNFCELKNAFTKIYPNFNIAYSYKTNYIPKLCKIVNEEGGYAEVVSEMEMHLARKIGVPLERIIWNGPIKNRCELETFLLEGGVSNIDNLNEALFIKKIADNNQDKVINVGVRCNYEVNDGVVSRFGLDTDGEDFNEVLEIIESTKNIHLINFQCHFAKRQIEFWPNRAKGMIEIIDKFQIIPERIDIGGGLFGKMENSLKRQFSSEIPSYEDYAKAVASIFSDYFEDKQEKPELIIEPGSALVGDCMMFVGTVKDIKEVRGKQFATILGSQKNISMTGVNPPIKVIHMGGDKICCKDLDIVGFTCIEGDVLYKNYDGELAIDDVIIISNCGSYSLVMKPPFILPNFAVIDVSGEKIEIIKRPESFEDIFNTFVI